MSTIEQVIAVVAVLAIAFVFTFGVVSILSIEFLSKKVQPIFEAQAKLLTKEQLEGWLALSNEDSVKAALSSLPPLWRRWYKVAGISRFVHFPCWHAYFAERNERWRRTTTAVYPRKV